MHSLRLSALLLLVPLAAGQSVGPSTVPRDRDHWFYIDDRDLGSKRAFAMIMMLFTLANTGQESSLPVLTIPTN